MFSYESFLILYFQQVSRFSDSFEKVADHSKLHSPPTPIPQCDLGPATPPCMGSPPSKAAHAQAGQQSGNGCVDQIPAPRGMASEIHTVARSRCSAPG